MTDNYKDKLRAVFDLCDVDRKGYISVQHFVELAKENFGADEQGDETLQSIVLVLDPEGDGRIDFKDFCRGVQQILELKTPSTPPALPGFYPGLNNGHVGGEETLVPGEGDNLSNGTHDNSELSTFNEYDMITDDDQSQIIVSPPHSDADSAICSRSPDRQHFEDFGERSEDSEKEASKTKKHRRNLSLPITKRLSPSSFMNHGYHNGMSRRSSASDDAYDDIDGSVITLTDKVLGLEDQLSDLTDKHEKSLAEQALIKGKNASLIERIHVLEEQVRDVELRANERIEEETNKRIKLLSKTDKEKTEEIDLLRQSLQHINSEYQYLKEESPRLRVENEKLKKEHAELTDRLSHTQQRLENFEDERTNQLDRLQAEKAEMEQERIINAQLFDELSKEVEELRAFKSAHEMHSAGNDVTRSQRREMDAHIDALKEENSRLREAYEELQNQMLSAHVQEGRRLMQAGASLAQEIENLSRDDLMKALKEAQEMNVKMHDYVDRMTLKIIEKNPSLLEIN